MAENTPEYLLAVDIGGTKVAAALITVDGRIVMRQTKPTCQDGPQPLMDQIVRMLDEILTSSETPKSAVQGVGVGIPAVLEPGSDRVIWAPNIQGWRNVPLRTSLEASLRLPVFVEYDGHTAVLGEWWQGAGRGYHSVAMVIIGTGIGGGLILDGKLIRGSNRLAGAAGWFALTQDAGAFDKYSQAIGHWESLAAGPGIARRAAVLLPEYPQSQLNQAAGESEITAKQIFNAAEEGDSLAKRVVEETAKLTGLGVANIISLVNPEIVVIGGSVGMQPRLLPYVREVVERWAQPVSAQSITLASSSLGTDAGLLGAAHAVLVRTKNH